MLQQLLLVVLITYLNSNSSHFNLLHLNCRSVKRRMSTNVFKICFCVSSLLSVSCKIISDSEEQNFSATIQKEDMAPKVELIEEISTVELGEGPHWDADTQSLYFVDIFGEAIHKYVPSTKKHTKAVIGEFAKKLFNVIKKYYSTLPDFSVNYCSLTINE